MFLVLSLKVLIVVNFNIHYEILCRTSPQSLTSWRAMDNNTWECGGGWTGPSWNVVVKKTWRGRLLRKTTHPAYRQCPHSILATDWPGTPSWSPATSPRSTPAPRSHSPAPPAPPRTPYRSQVWGEDSLNRKLSIFRDFYVWELVVVRPGVLPQERKTNTEKETVVRIVNSTSD